MVAPEAARVVAPEAATAAGRHGGGHEGGGGYGGGTGEAARVLAPEAATATDTADMGTVDVQLVGTSDTGHAGGVDAAWG